MSKIFESQWLFLLKIKLWEVEIEIDGTISRVAKTNATVFKAWTFKASFSLQLNYKKGTKNGQWIICMHLIEWL